jgi:hypothetical protein
MAHAVNLVVMSPRSGLGMIDQFCVQIDKSSSAFHGIGVKKNPNAEPPASFSKSRRVKFIAMIGTSLLYANRPGVNVRAKRWNSAEAE